MRLVAAADPDPARAGPDHGYWRRTSPVHDSEQKLLASAEVDAIMIATPHDLLAPLALAAIRAGKHVLVEKPVGLDEAEAREVEFAAASAGVTCMAGYTFRYAMARRMRELLDSGAVGDIVAITGSICAPPMVDGWTATPAAGGGPLLYLGCHLVDLVLWFAGAEPTAVSATVSVRPDTGCDDTSAIRLEFGAGPVSQLLVTQSAPGFSYDLTVIGSAGRLMLRGQDFTDYTIEVRSTALAEYAEPAELRPDEGGNPVETAVVPEIAEFAAAVEAGRAPAVTGSDARRVLRVLDAVRESGRRGGSAATLGDPMVAAF